MKELDDPQEWVKGPKYKVKKHRKERADQGWSEYDFWNFHNYHSWMMISVLERFKNGVGYPMGLTEQQWSEILDEMIDGFKSDIIMTDMINYDSKKQTYAEWQEPYQAKLKRALELFAEYYQSLWD